MLEGFNTNKNTIRLGTGLINKHWAMDGRLSSISSDGYLDRASADLSSYFLQGGYYGKKTIVKAITFAGKEKTYQAWYGTPEAKLNNDNEGVLASIANNWWGSKDSANLVNSGRTYNYYTYDNEVDNYAQGHYQLHLPNDKDNIPTEILFDKGYILNYKFETESGPQGNIKIALKYDLKTKSSAIKVLKRVSTPGSRNYTGAKELPRVLNGLGIAILSTSKGVITDKEARNENVGGEVLCHIY